MRFVFLFCLLSFLSTAFAQVNIKVGTMSPGRFDNTLLYAGNGRYIVKQTSLNPAQQNQGKFLVYSAESKLLGSIPYAANFKIKANLLAAAMVNDDKLTVILGAGQGYPYDEHILFWFGRFAEKHLTVLEYDLKTFKQIGEARKIEVPDYKEAIVRAVYSADGKNFAFIQHPSGDAKQKITYRLFKDGKEVFKKDYTLPTYTESNDLLEANVRLSNNGDLILACANKDKESESNTMLYYISSSTQALTSKKLEVKGKLVSKYPNMRFNKAGELIIVAEYAAPGKNIDYTLGFVAEKYAGSLADQKQHTEIPFTPETLAKCASSDAKNNPAGTLYRQRLRKVEQMEDGGLVLYSLQNVTRQTGPEKWDVTNNNLLCIALNEKFENRYQLVVHQLDKKSNFVIFEAAGMYSDGTNVYVLHAGTDDKVKNTADEFDVYCTHWKNSDPNPKTFEVTRAFADQHIFSANLREVEKNKLIMLTDGNGGLMYTTMSIEGE